MKVAGAISVSTVAPRSFILKTISWLKSPEMRKIQLFRAGYAQNLRFPFNFTQVKRDLHNHSKELANVVIIILSL